MRVEHDLQERDKYGRLFLVTKKIKKVLTTMANPLNSLVELRGVEPLTF